MASLDHIWPDGHARTLWNLDALQQPRAIPFLSYQFSSEFFFALAIGAMVIVLFASRRFNVHSSAVDSMDIRALRELKPMDLRATALMSQAYMRYVGVLLFIYLAFTLFGNLVLDAINTLPSAAGLQLDAQNVDFNSPQWPILISFGIAGFVPMLKPLDVIERRLRAWAHKSAGIPIRIAHQTNRVKRALDRLTEKVGEPADAPAWLAKIAPKEERDRTFNSLTQLTYLISWAKDQRAYWPSAKTRSVLRGIEKEELEQGFLTLEVFDDLMTEDYDVANAAPVPGAAPAPRWQAAGAIAGETTFVNLDPLSRHRKRLEREWNTLSDRIESQRDELASMLAIFAEHDRRTDEIANEQMRGVVEEASANETVEDGPTFWLYLSLLPVAAIYFLAISSDKQPLLSSIEKTNWSITLSTLLLVLRTFFLFVLPVALVMSWRHALREREDESWIDIKWLQLDKAMVRELIIGGFIGAAGSAAGLTFLSMFWVALLAHNEEQFLNTFLGGPQSFLAVYTSFALIAAVTAIMVLLAVEHVRLSRKRLARGVGLIVLGLLNVGLVLGAWAVLTEMWYGFGRCQDVKGFVNLMEAVMTDGMDHPCARTYELTDLLVFALLAFSSACLFVPRPKSDGETPPRPSFWSRFRARIHGLWGRRTTGTFLVIFLYLSALPLHAQTGTVEQPTATPEGEADRDMPKTVRIGFRKDVQPFAYYDESEERFRGYLVDLCYKIFQVGSGQEEYRVLPVPVTASTRFNAFKSPREEPAIDLLCDPVTLRYNVDDPKSSGNDGALPKDDGRDGGIFSPIVFASGVSYLHRRPSPDDGDVVMGWVRGSTAENVARRACRSDLFNARPTGSGACDAAPETTAQACSNLEPAAKAAKGAGSDSDTSETRARRYAFCEFESHTNAIDWFCSGYVEKAYFGDRDIIIGKIEAVVGRDNQRSNQCRGYESANATFTYEPYALIVKLDDPELLQFVQRRIYELFSNSDEIAGIFLANFGGKKMTATLANLYLLNAVGREH
ncbi:hypothetical protein [Salipiger abyssi]|uniref:hypothetical protein n=1 Tax=Salipiger abyssi TaxID=1250539 RepID=UPI004059C53C